MKKGCFISTAVIIGLLTAGLIFYFINQNKAAKTNTNTAQAQYLDIARKVVATGTIIPRQEINIKPQVSGVIDELFVEAGDTISKGTIIARIQLVPSQVNVNQAQSQVELARLRLQNAERELERQKVIHSQNLDVETAEANFENARTEEARQRQLYEAGVSSEQQYNQYKRVPELTRTAMDNALITPRINLSQYENQVDLAQQELNSAISNLRLSREGVDQNSRQVANEVSSTVSGMV